MARQGRVSMLFVAAVLASALLVTSARASDDESFVGRVKAFEAQVKDHRRAKSTSALEEDTKNAVKLYEGAEGEEQADKLRERIAKTVGHLTKVKDDRVRRAALEALGDMGDEAGARYVRSYLKILKEGKDAAVAMKAIDVAGEIADDSLVAPLLKIVDKAKSYKQAAAAMEALGHFKDCKRFRNKILEELATTLRRDVPGGPKRGQESQVADTYIPGKSGNSGTARWQSLAPVLPKVLNQLTGMSLPTAEDWMQIVQENKRDLGVLFQDDDT